MTRTPYEEFDFDKFWSHVEQYVIRWNLHLQDMADMIGMDVNTFRTSYRFKKSISLKFLCRLASLCDLDLNTYNKAEIRV